MCLFVATFCQDLLDRLLFLQQKGTNNALTNTGVADSPSITTRDLAFALLGALVFGGSQVLDSLE